MFENWLAGRCAPSSVPLVGDVVETSEMARQNGNELSYLRNRQGQVCVGVYGRCCLPSTRRSRPSLNDDPSLCATLYTVGGVGELYQRHFCEIVTLCRPPPHQDLGRARTAGSRLARDDKEPGPRWGKQLPGERPRETAETRHTSPQPSRRVWKKGAAPLSGVGVQIARAISAYAQCACSISLQMGSMN